jgi:hypothetical protein
MQSVPITTNAVRANPTQAGCFKYEGIIEVHLSVILLICLWCLMPLLTIFQLYRGRQFYCEKNHRPVAKSLTNFIT